MDFELDAGQRAWLAEIREFLRDNVTEELRAELAQHDPSFPTAKWPGSGARSAPRAGSG